MTRPDSWSRPRLVLLFLLTVAGLALLLYSVYGERQRALLEVGMPSPQTFTAPVDIEVVDLRTLLPLDEEAIIESVKKTNRLLVVHEDTRTGGIAGEIAMRVNEKAFEWLDAPILRVTRSTRPSPTRRRWRTISSLSSTTS